MAFTGCLANILPGSFAVTLPVTGTQNAVPTPQPRFQNQTGRLFRAAPFSFVGFDDYFSASINSNSSNARFPSVVAT